MLLNRITNEDADIQEKVNYFVDRFTYYLDNAGWQLEFEIENQLSLIQKIDFQLSNDNEYRLVYIDNYFSHRLFNMDWLWEEYKAFPAVKKQLKLYDDIGLASKSSKEIKAEKTSILNSAVFQKDIKSLYIELKHNMPGVLYEDLLSVFQCRFPLSEDDHINKLNLLAQLIVSAGFFTGKKNTEIYELIDRVFSKKGTFPYPPEVKTKTQKKKFDAEGRLANQIKGFTSIMRNDLSSGMVLMRLYGGTFSDQFEFHYEGVRFLGRKHPQVTKIYEGIANATIKRFFSEGSYIFLSTKLQWFSYSSVTTRMKSATVNQIKYFSSVLEREFNLDYTNNFIITNSQGKFLRGTYSTSQFEQVQLGKVEELKYGAVNKLAKIRDREASAWFLSQEPIFINAKKDSAMQEYWLYLETLLSYRRKDKLVKDIVSTLLLLDERKHQREHYISTLISCLNMLTSNDIIQATPKEFTAIEKALIKGQIPKALRQIQYPFIKEIVACFDQKIDAGKLTEIKRFYNGILTEAYGNRNFFVHKGLNNDTLVIKLERTFPLMVSRIRRILMNEININPDLPFDLILDSLINKGSELLKH